MLCSLETHIPEVLTLENKHDIIIRGHPPLAAKIQQNREGGGWMKKIKKMDSRYQNAYVITVQAKYKNNFINGLGLKANRFAMEYRVLRVPARSFINVAK